MWYDPRMLTTEAVGRIIAAFALVALLMGAQGCGANAWERNVRAAQVLGGSLQGAHDAIFVERERRLTHAVNGASTEAEARAKTAEVAEAFDPAIASYTAARALYVAYLEQLLSVAGDGDIDTAWVATFVSSLLGVYGEMQEAGERLGIEIPALPIDTMRWFLSRVAR